MAKLESILDTVGDILVLKEVTIYEFKPTEDMELLEVASFSSTDYRPLVSVLIILTNFSLNWIMDLFKYVPLVPLQFNYGNFSYS